MTAARHRVELVRRDPAERVFAWSERPDYRPGAGQPDVATIAAGRWQAVFRLSFVPPDFDRSWSLVDTDRGREIWQIEDYVPRGRMTEVHCVRESDTFDPIPAGLSEWDWAGEKWNWAGEEWTYGA